jgi:hypothetical protein
MEEKFINFLKKPKTIRIIYIGGCMVASFCLGVISQYNIAHKGNFNSVIQLPEKPLPNAYRYKTTIENPLDIIPAEPLTIESDTALAVISDQVTPQNFTASKSGKNYYPAGCAGINRIKPENRIYFSTEKEAQEKGYVRTLTCTE